MQIRNVILRTAIVLITTVYQAPLWADAGDRWLFRVYLDDREIGYHEFFVRDRDGGHQVEISARFDVRILFFNAYSYDHRNQETWVGDCLQDIESRTNDNGDEYLVTGENRTGDFMLAVNLDESRIDDGCVRTFAYWNPVILESTRLLNAQTGELIDVTVQAAGAETLDIGPHSVASERYTIEMKDGPIHLWYSPGGRHWLALEAVTEGGRTLRYVPQVLPWNIVGETRLAMD